MSKHYCYEYKKKPRVKKEFVYGDIHIPLNVGYETTIELTDSIEQASKNGNIALLKKMQGIIKTIFGNNYENFVNEFEKDGDILELEDFGDISMIVVASLNNVEPDKVDNFFPQ